MIKFFSLLFFIAISCFGNVAVHATTSLSLDEFLSRVKQKNVRLKLSKSNIKRAQLNYKLLQTGHDLDLTIFGGMRFNDFPDNGERSQRSTSVYGATLGQNQTPYGGKFELSYRNHEIHNDYSNSTVHKDDSLSFSYSQELLRDGFFGMNNRKLALKFAKLRIERMENEFQKTEARVLVNATEQFLRVVFNKKKLQSNEQRIDTLKNLINSFELETLSTQKQRIVMSLKSNLSELNVQKHSLLRFQDQFKVRLYDFMEESEDLNAFNFRMVSQEDIILLEASLNDLLTQYLIEHPRFLEDSIHVKRQELILKNRKHNKLPDLQLNTSVETKTDVASNAHKFEDPDYRVGLFMDIPVANRSKGISEDLAVLDLNDSKIRRKKNSDRFERDIFLYKNEFDVLQEMIAIYEEQIDLEKKELDLSISVFKQKMGEKDDYNFYNTLGKNVKGAIMSYEQSVNDHYEVLCARTLLFYELKFKRVMLQSHWKY